MAKRKAKPSRRTVATQLPKPLERVRDELDKKKQRQPQDTTAGLIKSIFGWAKKLGAREILIRRDPGMEIYSVLFNIGGNWSISMDFRGHLLHALTAKLKIMASADVAERRFTQIGHPPEKDSQPFHTIVFMPDGGGNEKSLILLN